MQINIFAHQYLQIDDFWSLFTEVSQTKTIWITIKTKIQNFLHLIEGSAENTFGTSSCLVANQLLLQGLAPD